MLALVVPFLIASLVAGQSPRSATQQMQNVHQGSGTMMPTVRKEAAPQYPAEAVAAGSQGIVELEVVVGLDGTVIHARVAKSLDEKFGLDREALAAARQWQFAPAVDGAGRPITALILLQFTFSLSGPQPRATGRIGELARSPLAPGSPTTSSPPIYSSTEKTSGFVNPKIVRSVQPQYTSAAMRAKIVGTVTLEVVIRADGTVGATRVVKSLDADLGLDQEALIAARYWIFEPATMNGQPVATRVTLELTFNLH
jgi:TonB family protein